MERLRHLCFSFGVGFVFLVLIMVGYALFGTRSYGVDQEFLSGAMMLWFFGCSSSKALTYLKSFGKV